MTQNIVESSNRAVRAGLNQVPTALRKASEGKSAS